MATREMTDIRPRRLEDEEDPSSSKRTTNNDASSLGRGRAEVVIAVLAVIAVCGLVLGVIGIAKSGHIEVEYEQEFDSSFGQGSKDKVWTFAIGHYDVNLEYLDEESGTIKGYNVDIINAVCKIANKNCELVYDSYDRCWVSEAGKRAKGGEGLLAGWYDACTGWGISYDRARVFSFTKAYSKLPGVGLYVANTTMGVDWRYLTGRRVGFARGLSTDEHCLARYAGDVIQGAKLTLSSNQFVYYDSTEELAAAVIDKSVEIAFCYDEPSMKQLKRLTDASFDNKCVLDGFAMMTKKGRTDFIGWWNDAFDKLVTTVEYRLICDDLKKTHGHIPGGNPDEVCL